MQFFHIPQQYHSTPIERWKSFGQPTLSAFAPYAAYGLMVEIFFHISIATNLISPERPSNRTDIAYLFYLPFCMMFVSNDRLHRRTTNLFLRSDQEFVWGSHLKDDLKRLNTHFSALPEEERDQGILRMARQALPVLGACAAALGRRHCGGGRLRDTDFEGRGLWRRRLSGGGKVRARDDGPFKSARCPSPGARAARLPPVNGGAKLVHPGGAKLVHLTLCGTRCWGVVPVVHGRDPRCFV